MTQQEWLVILVANVVAAVATFIFHFKFHRAERTIHQTPLQVANRFIKAMLVSGLLTMLGVGIWNFVWLLRHDRSLGAAALSSVFCGLGYGTPIALSGVPGSLGASLIALMIPSR